MFDINDEGETFYIIIKGICSVLIRNPKIRDWYANWIQYRKLLQWKLEDFDPRMVIAKKEAEEKYEMQIKHEFENQIQGKMKDTFEK